MNNMSYADAFASYLKKGGVSFEVIRKSGDLTVLKLGFDMIEIDDSSCHLTRLLKPISRSKYSSALETVNRLNQEFSYCQFNIIKVNPYYMCVSYYFSLYGEADDVAFHILKMYKIFMKITKNIV
ncbi:MAG: hypothetical protein K2G36_04920 [Ruminococcus sp.]|nr:hypothetical protein [Ruminococcus sp.]